MSNAPRVPTPRKHSTDGATMNKNIHKDDTPVSRESPSSVMNIIECPFIPIPITPNETGIEDQEDSPWKKRKVATKGLKRGASLNDLHDPSSIVEKVRSDPVKRVRRHEPLKNNAISGDDLAAVWPETWEVFQQVTAATARRNKIHIDGTDDRITKETPPATSKVDSNENN